MIAALFVVRNGVYYGLPDVDPWDEARDARNYAGPWPVVAHPPCERWGRYHNDRIGEDDGCFEAALSATRKWGGVLEHPEGSHAWRFFGLNIPPRAGGWVVADFVGGWTCCIEQGSYGHRARKRTWLYANGIELPILKWGRAPGDFVRARPGRDLRREIRTGACQRLSRNQRRASPLEFRDLLIGMVNDTGTAGTHSETREGPAPCPPGAIPASPSR